VNDDVYEPKSSSVQLLDKRLARSRSYPLPTALTATVLIEMTPE
jgi:hypothetical protein